MLAPWHDCVWKSIKAWNIGLSSYVSLQDCDVTSLKAYGIVASWRWLPVMTSFWSDNETIAISREYHVKWSEMASTQSNKLLPLNDIIGRDLPPTHGTARHALSTTAHHTLSVRPTISQTDLFCWSSDTRSHVGTQSYTINRATALAVTKCRI